MLTHASLMIFKTSYGVCFSTFLSQVSGTRAVDPLPHTWNPSNNMDPRGTWSRFTHTVSTVYGGMDNKAEST